MTAHGISSVVRELGIKPRMKRIDQLGIGSLVSQIRTAFDIPISDLDLPWLGSLEHSQTRHFLPVNMGWSRKISSLKLGFDLLQVSSNQRYLLGIVHLCRDNPLVTPSVRRGEDVRGCLEAEWHYVFSPLGHDGLSLCVGRRDQHGRHSSQGEQGN